MELIGYVVESTLLAALGSGDESLLESAANQHEEALAAIERKHRLEPGAAEETLRGWILEGHGRGRAARAVLETFLLRSNKDRLADDAWSPVRAASLEDLDAALQKAGVPRNASIRKLARPTCGAGQRPLTLEDGLLHTLSGHAWFTVESVWPAAIARMTGDEATRAKALLRWWETTKTRHVEASMRGRTVSFDVVVALA